jgi:RHS repeat-associated protein
VARHKYRHFVKAGGQTVVTVEDQASGSIRLFRYMHRDHLGSVDAVTDANGSATRYAYDIHGNRRSATNWTQTYRWTPQANEINALRDRNARGFTDHEMLDNVSLIHMNGRVYDPEIGRFMSVDPVWTSPGFTDTHYSSLRRVS